MENARMEYVPCTGVGMAQNGIVRRVNGSGGKITNVNIRNRKYSGAECLSGKCQVGIVRSGFKRAKTYAAMTCAFWSE